MHHQEIWDAIGEFGIIPTNSKCLSTNSIRSPGGRHAPQRIKCTVKKFWTLSITKKFFQESQTAYHEIPSTIRNFKVLSESSRHKQKDSQCHQEIQGARHNVRRPHMTRNFIKPHKSNYIFIPTQPKTAPGNRKPWEVNGSLGSCPTSLWDVTMIKVTPLQG